MPRLFLMVATLAMVLAQTAPAVGQLPLAPSFEPKAESPEVYPDFTGRAEAFGFCGACHAFRLATSQRMTREQWDASLTWMTERHAMPVLEPVDRNVILDYLAKAFPPRAPANGRSDWRNPFTPQ